MGDQRVNFEPLSRRILHVEDEEFTRTAVHESLEKAGFIVESAKSVAEALPLIEIFDPHAVVTDLDLGLGPSGIDLMLWIHENRPWVGLVALTAHQSVPLAVGKNAQIPEGTVMLVKSALDSMSDIAAAIEESISQAHPEKEIAHDKRTSVVISPVQAEILFLIAEGLSNNAIAERRGTSLRAAEALVQRTLHALGIELDRDYNSRVLAVRMWQNGQVTVR